MSIAQILNLLIKLAPLVLNIISALERDDAKWVEGSRELHRVTDSIRHLEGSLQDLQAKIVQREDELV